MLFCLILFIFCKSLQKTDVNSEIKTGVFKTTGHKLIKPIKNAKVILILFCSFREKSTDIKREFKIVDMAKKNQISLVNELKQQTMT